MERKYMLELRENGRYSVHVLSLTSPIEFKQFVLTVHSVDEAGRIRAELRPNMLLAVFGCGVSGGHYEASDILQLCFDPAKSDAVGMYDTDGNTLHFRIMERGALLDRFSGCIIGGAIGDALGYAVEFDPYANIVQRYGKKGIRNFELVCGVAEISDDTQMTLFTMDGLTRGMFRAAEKGIGANAEVYVNWAYCDWYVTQEGMDSYSPFTKIFHDQRLHAWRAPGNTCLGALSEQFVDSSNPPYSNRFATIQQAANDSKGCGAVMRAAPVGLMLSSWNYGCETAASVAAKTGAITHGHPLGWLPAACLAALVHNLTYPLDRDHPSIVQESLATQAVRTLDELKVLFADVPHWAEFEAICRRAITLAESGKGSDVDHVHALGGGWVGEEALAIALYAAIRHENDFHAAMCCAVNHGGDSDSTGSIAGNILGAYHGLEEILRQSPFRLSELELSDLMLQAADDALTAALINVS